MAARFAVTLISGVLSQITTADSLEVGSGVTTESGNLTVGSAGGLTTLTDANVTIAGNLAVTGTEVITGGSTFTGAVTFNGLATFAHGIAASGAFANNFSGSTGDFSASTGALSWAGASGKAASLTSTAANITIATVTSGTVSVDSAAALNLGGGAATSVTVGNNATTTFFQLVCKSTAVIQFFAGASECMAISSTAVNLDGGISLTANAGAGGVDFHLMTGNWQGPTGTYTWAGASGKAASLTSTAANITISSTTSGTVAVDSAAAATLGATNATSVTVGNTANAVTTTVQGQTSLVLGVGSHSWTQGNDGGWTEDALSNPANDLTQANPANGDTQIAGFIFRIRAQAGQNAVTINTSGGNGGEGKLIGGAGGSSTGNANNSNGGPATLASGVPGTGGGGTAGLPGLVQLSPGNVVACQFGDQGIHFAATTSALATGTLTLTAAQARNPALNLTGGALSGNLTVVFPNAAGTWFVDTSGITLNGHSLILQSGTATATYTVLSVKTLITVNSQGGNTIAVTGGGTFT